MQGKKSQLEGLDQLEAHWEQRVEEAQARYLRAIQEKIRMEDEVRRTISEEPGGVFLTTRARRAEAIALSELQRTIRIYTDLVLKGLIPLPEDDEQPLI